jgi:hypothetical protein
MNAQRRVEAPQLQNQPERGDVTWTFMTLHVRTEIQKTAMDFTKYLSIVDAETTDQWHQFSYVLRMAWALRNPSRVWRFKSVGEYRALSERLQKMYDYTGQLSALNAAIAVEEACLIHAPQDERVVLSRLMLLSTRWAITRDALDVVRQREALGQIIEIIAQSLDDQSNALRRLVIQATFELARQTNDELLFSHAEALRANPPPGAEATAQVTLASRLLMACLRSCLEQDTQASHYKSVYSRHQDEIPSLMDSPSPAAALKYAWTLALLARLTGDMATAKTAVQMFERVGSAQEPSRLGQSTSRSHEGVRESIRLSFALWTLYQLQKDVRILAPIPRHIRHATSLRARFAPGLIEYDVPESWTLLTLPFELEADLQSLQPATHILRRLGKTLPHHHPDLYSVVITRARALTLLANHTCYNRSSRATAVASCERLLNSPLHSETTRGSILLAIQCAKRSPYSAMFSSQEDLKTAISYGEQALKLLEGEYPKQVVVLTELGISLRLLFEHDGNQELLRQSLDLLVKAYRSPAEALYRPWVLVHLGICIQLCRIHEILVPQGPFDVNALLAEALHLLPPQSPERPFIHISMAEVMASQNDGTGSQVIDTLLAQAEEALPLQHPLLHRCDQLKKSKK